MISLHTLFIVALAVYATIELTQNEGRVNYGLPISLLHEVWDLSNTCLYSAVVFMIDTFSMFCKIHCNRYQSRKLLCVRIFVPLTS